MCAASIVSFPQFHTLPARGVGVPYHTARLEALYAFDHRIKMKIFNYTIALALSTTSSILSLVHSQTHNQKYTPEQCTYWLFTAQSSDIDNSNGLSQDEYYSFLTSISDPIHVNDYFSQYDSFANLPWEYKVIHKTMLCNCMRMEQGSDCCVGSDVEVMLAVNDGSSLQMRQHSASDEYEEIFCEQIAFLVSSVEVPPTMSPEIIPPAPAPPQQEMNTSHDVDIEAQEAQDGSTTDTLGAGVIIGIFFALFVPLCGGCFLLARQRKLIEDKRLREFAGEAANMDHLASDDVMSEERAPAPNSEEIDERNVEAEQDIVVEPENPVDETVNKYNNESDDNDSVWSNGERKDEKQMIVDTDQDFLKSTIGSALAAMGVASRVATSIMSPTSKNDVEDSTKINAVL